MNFSNIFFSVFVVGSILACFFTAVVETIQFFYRKKYGTKIPTNLAQTFTPEKMEKIAEYQNELYFVFLPQHFTESLVSILLLALGVYARFFYFLQNHIANQYLLVIVFMFSQSLLITLIDLPFNCYRDFVTEKKYGFSNMTVKLFIGDLLKLLIISFIFTSLLFSVGLLIVSLSSYWYIIFPTVYLLFSFVINILAPIIIDPLFNKFTPLADGEVKDVIITYLKKCGFSANGIFVADASKRSAHSNAYFTGFGKSKRVVIYDTLLKQLTPQEMGGVIAHELGHFKKHHILKRFIVMGVLVYAVFIAAQLLIQNARLYAGFGFNEPVTNPAVMIFIGVFLLLQIISAFSPFFSLIGNFFSRRDECAADAYAKKLCGTGADLSNSLIKLYDENKSDILVAPIYSLANDSHPTLLERIKAVED